jgi:hypothetical protein
MTIMYKELLKLATWKKVLILLFLGLVIFAGWFVYEIVTDEPPNFFPLGDTQAEYRITKNCPNNQGWVEQTQGEGIAYCLEYRGNNVLWKEDHGNSNFFSITIGKSNIDLSNYVNKKVKNIKGKYTSSGKQCIQNKCTDIGGPFVVVNIDRLELVN